MNKTATTAFNRPLPSKEEIKEVLEFSERIFEDVCSILDIRKDELV